MLEKNKIQEDDIDKDSHDLNRDPITGAPGAHPLGTGVGAAGGAAAGAAIGAVGGPVGSIIGGSVGAVAGGLIGKGVAEGIDPTIEEEYWREEYLARPYYEEGFSYDEDYLPAYRYGWETRRQYSDRRFEDVESDLESGWDGVKHKSRLNWQKAKKAMRDAWQRIENRDNRD